MSNYPQCITCANFVNPNLKAFIINNLYIY